MSNIMYYAGIAEEYYVSACPSYVQNGYDKNVLVSTLTGKCIFVSGDVEPDENELLFRCKTAHGKPIVTQKSMKKPQPVAKQWSRRYEGVIRHCTYGNGKEDDFAYPPELLDYVSIQAVKLDNMDYFLHQVMALNDFKYATPFEILSRLEARAMHNDGGLPFASLLIPYHRDEERDGECMFNFSHYEKFESGLCVVYEYTGTCG